VPVGIARSQEMPAHIEVLPGTLPVILTVPHGGSLKPEGILARRYGVVAKDTNTAELSLMIIEEMKALHGGTPHAVICHLHRSKVDCNRELKEAAQGEPQAIAAWERFHNAAEAMEQQVTKSHGAGLVLDIHGHRHEEARVELGYLLKGAQLNVSDAALEANSSLLAQTSIRELDRRSSQSFAELLRGPQSLGALLERRGFKCIPSPTKPGPGDSAYYSGSYDVLAHGSKDSGSISAIQMECPWTGVRDTPENQRRFAKALAAALGDYFRAHFGRGLGKRRAGE